MAEELAELMPAEMLPHTTPIPTQIVSSDGWSPQPALRQAQGSGLLHNKVRGEHAANA
jgi:hypothetical protein